MLGSISLLVASLGIMKAIGAEERVIKKIFFVEASVIGLVGGVTGAILAWGVDGIANQLAYRFILQPRGVDFLEFFWLPPYLWLGALALALLSRSWPPSIQPHVLLVSIL